jgi:kynurenine formamidase
VLDSQAGTHVTLPSFSLPSKDFDTSKYSSEIQALLKKYESKYGSIGRSALTIDQVPLASMQGSAHMIDVRKLVGSAGSGERPRSPQITLDFIREHEAAGKPIRAGEVVIFQSGHTDRHFSPLPAAPEVDPLLAGPLTGKSEGWPAPTPEVLAYLADKGVRAIGTDGPTLGGVDREQALFVSWMAGTRGLLVVEFLTGLDQIREREAYFIFAPVKIKGLRSGYGRAIALF